MDIATLRPQAYSEMAEEVFGALQVFLLSPFLPCFPPPAPWAPLVFQTSPCDPSPGQPVPEMHSPLKTQPLRRGNLCYWKKRCKVNT